MEVFDSKVAYTSNRCLDFETFICTRSTSYWVPENEISQSRIRTWYGMVWGTRDGDPLGGLVLLCREEISCAITTPSSCTKAGRSYRGGQKDLLDSHSQRQRKM